MEFPIPQFDALFPKVLVCTFTYKILSALHGLDLFITTFVVKGQVLDNLDAEYSDQRAMR
jgi:hypothetical protein